MVLTIGLYGWLLVTIGITLPKELCLTCCYDIFVWWYVCL